VIRAMTRAIHDAGIRREPIGYINAHGTSTPLGDISETLAIKKTFGDHAYKLAFSSTKSMTGQLAWRGRRRLSRYSPFSRFISEDCRRQSTITRLIQNAILITYPINRAKVTVECALTNGFGFGGTNASLVFRRFHEAEQQLRGILAEN